MRAAVPFGNFRGSATAHINRYCLMQGVFIGNLEIEQLHTLPPLRW